MEYLLEFAIVYAMRESLNFFLLDILFDVCFGLLGCLVVLHVEQLVLVRRLYLLNLVVNADDLVAVLVHAHEYLVLEIGNSVALNTLKHFII